METLRPDLQRHISPHPNVEVIRIIFLSLPK